MLKMFLKPGFLIGITVGLIISLCGLFDFSDKLEHHAFDAFMKATADPKKWPSGLAIVLIDETSLQQLSERVGRWPWRRDVYAGLAAYLKKAGAREVIFDILFVEPSMEPIWDDKFSTYIHALKNIRFSALMQPPLKPLLPIESLLDASQNKIGFVNVSKDHDGVLRNYWIKNPDSSSSIQSLAASVSENLQITVPQTDSFLIRWYGNEIQLKDSIYSAAEPALSGLEMVERIAKIGSPKDFDTDDWKQVSKLIESDPEHPRLNLSGKIVFVGSSAVATEDQISTPLKSIQPGVLFQATALANLIRGDYIRTVPDWVRCLFILINSSLVSLVCIRIQTVRFQASLTLLIILALSILSFVLFNENLWLPPVLAGVASVLSYTCITTYNYVVEGKQKRMFKQLFSDFVSPDVLEELLSTPNALNLAGDSRMGTVLFCDLSGFTTFTETATPPQLIEAINTYYSEASQILLSHGAYVDKYIGDAVMAIFNIPKEREDHAIEACIAALRLPIMIKDLNKRLQQQYPHINLKLRTGVNTGMMVAGPMGYARKLNYSALGDSVNLASRLEGANKEYHTLVMIGPITYDLAKDHIEVRSLDFLRVKGKNKPVRVYELMAKKGELTPEQIKLRAAYHEGFELYQNRQWKEAIQAFERALLIIPEDGPSQVYIERCKHFQNNPPATDWDGSFGLDTK
jgi:adenylate cyclase